jgi:small subunit ribosomal protein S11
MASLFTPRSFASSVCQSCRLRLKPAVSQRAFGTTPVKPIDSALFGLQNISENNARRRRNDRGGTEELLTDILASPSRIYNDAASHNLDAATEQKAHRLHVLATKHNTHLTLVQPPKPASQTTSSGISSTNASAADQKKMVDVLLSLSAGNIGFKKAGRGSYDAAYQLTAFTLKTMQERGMMHDINKLEIVMRGFGAGREAVTKAILGAEGKNIRDRISAVLDATRLKIGGTRSPKPRRLG